MNPNGRKTKLEAAPRYITLSQAAAYLSLSPKTLYRLVDSRRIPFTAINVSPRKPGNPKRIHYRFDRLLLDSFMTANAAIPPQSLAWSPTDSRH